MGALNTSFHMVNLHRPTVVVVVIFVASDCQRLDVATQVESERLSLNAVHHISASIAETKHGEAGVNLGSTCTGLPQWRPRRLLRPRVAATRRIWRRVPHSAAATVKGRDLKLEPRFESGSSYFSFNC